MPLLFTYGQADLREEERQWRPVWFGDPTALGGESGAAGMRRIVGGRQAAISKTLAVRRQREGALSPRQLRRVHMGGKHLPLDFERRHQGGGDAAAYWCARPREEEELGADRSSKWEERCAETRCYLPYAASKATALMLLRAMPRSASSRLDRAPNSFSVVRNTRLRAIRS